MFIKRQLVIILVCVLFFNNEINAEIYKYQDENGKWHFTDRNPGRDKEPESMPLTEAGNSDQTQGRAKDQGPSRSKTVSGSLLSQLQNQYSSGSPIELASLAVLTVETSLGTGSGFFISDAGHIVTNKHVIRPSTDKMEKKLEARTRLLSREQQRLDRWERDNNRYAGDIDKFRRNLDGLLPYERSSGDERLRDHEDGLRERWRGFNVALNAFKKSRKIHREESLKFRRAKSRARGTDKFKVVFKDQTSMHATLIKISSSHDLALLKVERHQTPSLLPETQSVLRQGSKVFAIGSPLGLRDYVTSGIIARVNSNEIITDTQILPGNSGGPLLNQEGRVLGVNTMKQVAGGNAMQEGFGVAISIATVMDEFGRYLPNGNDAQ